MRFRQEFAAIILAVLADIFAGETDRLLSVVAERERSRLKPELRAFEILERFAGEDRHWGIFGLVSGAAVMRICGR